MLLKDYPVVLPDYILTLEELSPENCLFFDIETTGLSWKTSHLYLLGAVFYENEIWIHRQWFCQKPSEEKEVLLAFSELLSTRKLLFHYNGTTFDVPYQCINTPFISCLPPGREPGSWICINCFPP